MTPLIRLARVLSVRALTNTRLKHLIYPGLGRRELPLSDERRTSGGPTAFRYHLSGRSLVPRLPDLDPARGDPTEHRGYDTRRASADKNVVLPLDHLRAAARAGRIGALSPTVYSFMGYIADTERLLRETAPTVSANLVSDGADLVLLAPT